MPHQRDRFAESYIKRALSLSPIVGLIGQRQVGKTTLAEKFAPKTYVSFDAAETLELAKMSIKSFLSQTSHLLAIDECQKLPEVFPALKLTVQKRKQPGQYLLTGSIRFTARSVIKESLTGRIINIELLPLTVAEMGQLPIQDFTLWNKFSESKLQALIHERIKKSKTNIMVSYLERGGLPDFWFIRNRSFLSEKFKSHLATLLQRDIKLIIQTTVPFENLLELLRHLAFRQGRPFDLSAAVRESQISTNTLKKILFAFENMFLIRRVLGMGYIKAPTFFFEDQGMASYLAPYSEAQNFERFAFSQIFSQAHYNHMGTFDAKHYESKSGSIVPFVFIVNHKAYGFLISKTSELNTHTLRTATSFLESVPNSEVIILDTVGKDVQRYGAHILKVPLLGVI